MSGGPRRLESPYPWPPARVAELERLWAKGYSCSQIGARLDPPATRNAIIGKAHRLGLPGRQPGVNAIRGRAPKVNPGRLAAPVKARAKAKAKLREPPPPTEAERLAVMRSHAWEPLPGTTPIGLLYLTEHTCRWPLGERPFLYCGCASKIGAPYCEAHMSMASSTSQKLSTLSSKTHRTKGFSDKRRGAEAVESVESFA
jgi:GcrA cell cycle regulator